LFVLVEQEGDDADADDDEVSEAEDSKETSSEDNLSDIEEDDDDNDDDNSAAATAADDDDDDEGDRSSRKCESPPKKRVCFAGAVDFEKPKPTVSGQCHIRGRYLEYWCMLNFAIKCGNIQSADRIVFFSFRIELNQILGHYSKFWIESNSFCRSQKFPLVSNC